MKRGFWLPHIVPVVVTVLFFSHTSISQDATLETVEPAALETLNSSNVWFSIHFIFSGS